MRYVCSKENAISLKALGVKQESIFKWVESMSRYYLQMDRDVRDSLFDPRCFENISETANCKTYYAAFISEEIGDIIRAHGYTPPMYDVVKRNWWFLPVKPEDEWIDWVNIAADNESDARAQMLIYLIENGLVKI